LLRRSFFEKLDRPFTFVVKRVVSRNLRSRGHVTPEVWEVVGVWFAAVGQTATAAAIVWYTRSSRKADSLKHLVEMLNDWNRLVIERPEHMQALGELRPPVLSHPKDSIIFCYLNCLRIQHVMRTERLITEKTEQAAIRNGLTLFKDLGRDKLEQYLSRGYDPIFKSRILTEFDNMPR
jgi:hypothetical protein